MLTSEVIVNRFLENFIEEYDGRSNRFYNKVKGDKDFYINLVELYNKTNSANKVSEVIRLDSKYITTILKKFGVSTAKRKMGKEVLQLVIADKAKGLSLGDLRTKYKFSLETIKRNLNNAGIDTSVEDPNHKLSEKVIEEYKSKQLKEIAKDYEVGVQTVKKYLISKGVKLRTLSQSMSLNIKKNGVNFKGKNILYNSVKNNCDILANSSYELARFIDLEADNNVILYTKDVETICYNNCVNSYTADIYIEYKNGKKVIEEVKPNWFLEYMHKTLRLLEVNTEEEVSNMLKISPKSVKKFILSDLKFKEANRYFTKKGIKYIIITEDNIDIKLSQEYLKTK